MLNLKSIISLSVVLCLFAIPSWAVDLPVITEITPVPTVEKAATYREGNMTCMEARAILQDAVGAYFDLDQEIEESAVVLGFMDEPTQLRTRADFLEKIAAMGDRMSIAWIDCVKFCEE